MHDDTQLPHPILTPFTSEFGIGLKYKTTRKISPTPS